MFIKPESRNIYRYWDGSKQVGADPIKLSNRLACQGGDLENDWKRLQLANQESVPAFERLVAFARSVFNLKDYGEDEGGNSSGLTDAEAICVLVDFGTYVEEKKQDFFSWPTLPISTGPPSSNGGQTPPTTSASSASTSTGSGPSAEDASRPSPALPPA